VGKTQTAWLAYPTFDTLQKARDWVAERYDTERYCVGWMKPDGSYTHEVQPSRSPKIVGYITVVAGLADMAVYSDSPNLSEHFANPTFRTHDGESPLGCLEELR
jgi:hypothetical protein